MGSCLHRIPPLEARVLSRSVSTFSNPKSPPLPLLKESTFQLASVSGPERIQGWSRATMRFDTCLRSSAG
jgi:hypothetical protein